MGMDTKTAYTPLECLLVFQSLAALGTDDKDFIYTSEMLNKSPLVRNCPSYDAQRLEASALRELYLRLLQDELKTEEQEGHEEVHQPASRKRKLLNTKVPSINECRQYRHKIPLLVERLYARYRDHMIKSIEEDERRFVKLQGQIKQIERGEWDDRTLEESQYSSDHEKTTPKPKINGTCQGSPKHEKISSALKDSIKPSSSSEIDSADVAKINLSCDPEVCVSPSHTAEGTKDSPSRPSLSKRTNTKLQKLQQKSTTQSTSDRKLEPLSMKTGQVLTDQNTRSELPSSKISRQPHTETPKKTFSTSSATTPPPSPIHLLTPKNSFPSSPGVKYSGIALDTLADTVSQHCTPSVPRSSGSHNDISDSSIPSFNSNDNQTTLSERNCQELIPQSIKTSTLKNLKFRQNPSSKPLVQSESKQYSSPYNTGQGSGSSTPKAHSASISTNKLNAWQNISLSSNFQGSRKVVTGCGTFWNPNPTGLTPRNSKPLSPPQMEPLSPILKCHSPLVGRASQKQACKQEKSELNKSPKDDPEPNRPSTPAPSVTDNYSRNDLHIPEEARRSSGQSLGVDNVKQENKSTTSLEDNDSKNIDASSIPKHLKILSSPNPTGKRKRKTNANLKSQPPSSILWTKAFPKISAQALQDISTDKNASMFANPVKERDAPGYRNVILRPQDLKSIRSAITAGHRAALAVAPADLDPSATNVWLPISEDLIPPKGIINYAQLEKELMRMFANAIMFNADPRRGLGTAWQDAIERSKEEPYGYSFDEDSVVKGTRDMFAAVEKKVSDLRSVERRNEKFLNAQLINNHADVEDDSACSDESHTEENNTVTKKWKKA